MGRYEESIGINIQCVHCGSTDAANLERMSEVDDRTRTGNYYSGQSTYSPRRKIWLCGDCIEPYVLADHNVLYNDRTAVRVPIRFNKAIEMTSQGGDTRMLRKCVPSTPDAKSNGEKTAAPAVEDDPELDALLAPLSESELESDRAFDSTLKTPTMEMPPEQNESDLARLRRPFVSLGLDLKKSDHGSKYLLDKLTESQLDRILAALVSK